MLMLLNYFPSISILIWRFPPVLSAEEAARVPSSALTGPVTGRGGD